MPPYSAEYSYRARITRTDDGQDRPWPPARHPASPRIYKPVPQLHRLSFPFPLFSLILLVPISPNIVYSLSSTSKHHPRLSFVSHCDKLITPTANNADPATAFKDARRRRRRLAPVTSRRSRKPRYHHASHGKRHLQVHLRRPPPASGRLPRDGLRRRPSHQCRPDPSGLHSWHYPRNLHHCDEVEALRQRRLCASAAQLELACVTRWDNEDLDFRGPRAPRRAPGR